MGGQHRSWDHGGREGEGPVTIHNLSSILLMTIRSYLPSYTVTSIQMGPGSWACPVSPTAAQTATDVYMLS